MKYAYFPGCSAHSTGISYTKSYDYVARAAGIELAEIPDWNCCGASAAHAESELLGDALPARSLALAEEAFGDAPVLAPCAGCYQHLKTATAHAQESEELRVQLEGIIGRPWAASSYVANGLEPFLPQEAQERISAHVTWPLNGLKVACYYGCALLRPAEVCAFDDDEQPHTMEQLVALSGAEPVEWHFKNECCGASHQVTVPELGRSMVRRILENAHTNGADAIACACPLCMLNLDMREAKVNAARAKEGLPALDIPIYYFTELLATSMGANQEESGIGQHFHPATNPHGRALESWQRQQGAQKAAAEAERAAKEAQRKARAAARAAKAQPKAGTEAKAKPTADAAAKGAAPAAKPADDTTPTSATGNEKGVIA